MNDEECQPDYCDCEGFHTGACHERHRERQLEEILKTLDKMFSEAHYRSLYHKLANEYNEHNTKSR